MLYIITALKSEAQAFVDKYKLQASTLCGYKTFYNDNMNIIVSGVGVENATYATQTFINHYDIIDEDIYLNIGICGATSAYPIGSLLEIATLSYHDKKYSLHNTSGLELHCVDKELCTNKYEIVDMESFGFYNAVRHSPAIKNYHILKIVSDHFKPESITKDFTKSLLFNVIDDINLLINTKVT